MPPIVEDLSKVACYQNPVLDPDAWSMVRMNHPHDDGVYAVLVCRFACPMLNQCPFEGGGSEIIARGGWYNTAGAFRETPAELIDITHAAAYLGVTPQYLKIVAAGKDSIKAYRYAGKAHIEVQAMLDLVDEVGPKHGTVRMHRLHLIRGEQPCVECRNPTSQEVVKSRGRPKKERQRV